MTRLIPALAVALAALASNTQAQVDYHRADLIRTAPAKLMGVPEDWGRGFGAAIGFARPTWLADSTRFWYSVMTPKRDFQMLKCTGPELQLTATSC